MDHLLNRSHVFYVCGVWNRLINCMWVIQRILVTTPEKLSEKIKIKITTHKKRKLKSINTLIFKAIF